MIRLRDTIPPVDSTPPIISQINRDPQEANVDAGESEPTRLPSHEVHDQSMPTAITRAAGYGGITVDHINLRSSVTRLTAHSPLKLLVPRHNTQAAWIFGSTYGGGLVEGDHIDLDVRINSGATAMLGTQASTKIYSCQGGRACVQSLKATVENDALLVLSPDPVTCFADAIYEQRQRFDLASRGSLISIDWFTAGRVARGERWAFRKYQSRTEIFVNGSRLVHDALVLDPGDGPIAAAHRVGRYDCIATVFVLGPRVAELAVNAAKQVSEQPIGKRLPLIQSASELAGGGVLMRAAGVTTQLVAAWLREKLSPVIGQLGDDPWGRKW